MKLSLCISFSCLAVCGLSAATSQDVIRTLATAPLRFEPAPGAAGVRYVARGARFRFEFSSNEAAFLGESGRIRLRFAGANAAARVEGDQPLRSKTAAFIGNDPAKWRREIPNYGRLQVQELYCGIDLVYYGNAGELEYDLKVRPGADPRQVRLRLDGAKVRVDRDGNLVAGVIQKRPAAYQIAPDGARIPIESSYHRNRDGSFGFALGRYDRTRELVIDPVLTLSAYIGGSQQEVAYGIGHDAAGFFYVAGSTSSIDFPLAGSSLQTTLNGGLDLFVAKIDPNAAPGSQVIYSTYIGGAAGETFGGMAVGPNGDVYITGTTISGDFPTSNGFQTTIANSASTDAFVLWLDSFQTLVYSSYIGGAGADTGLAVAVDAGGRIWITGGTQSDDFPNLRGIQSTRAGSQDIFITGVDPKQTGTGTLIYSTYIGGSGWDTGRGIAVASDGTLWIAGGTYSSDINIVGASYQRSYRNSGDGYLAHVNPSLGVDSLVYSTYLGGSGLEEARNVVLDSAGRPVVSGYTLSGDFPTTADALQPSYGGNTDAFVSILDPTQDRPAQLVYSTYFGGANADVPFDLKRDAAGALYLVGFTTSDGLATSAGALQSRYDGTVDGFVLKLDPTRRGSAGIDYLSYVGSAGLQVVYGVDVGANGNIYLAGSTSGSIFSAFGGAQKPTDPGNTDAFIMGFSTCGFDISLQSEQFPASGGSDIIAVIVQNGDCSWTASSNLDWVTVSPASGSGNGSVKITVTPNTTGAERQGTINIAGIPFLVGQNQ
jgi:all-beta uncharacterized protein/beta-propeller repeat-containing protein